jgi:hypothetical protein
LPLAGRYASESARSAEAQALANTWYGELVTRGAHHRGNWFYFQDSPVGGVAVGVHPYRDLPASIAVPGNPPVPRSVTKQAVCIDPYFIASRDLGGNFGAFSYTAGNELYWYRPSVFPYYAEHYNPLVDPAWPMGTTAGSALPPQPRMVRVTLGSSAANLVSAKFAETLFGSQDDLAISTDEYDRSIAPTRTLSLGGSLVPVARAAAKNEYSWLATISPCDTLANSNPVEKALLSLAVIHRRDRLFFTPGDGTSISTRTAGMPASTDDKPIGERMYLVEGYTDFSGGHGGSVRLRGSDGTKAGLHVGDWLMLGKNRPAAGAGVYPVFRWYRIAAVNSEPVVSAGTPNGYWEMDVVLDGPDWVFDPANVTTATHVSGVVTVLERVIDWN